MAEMNAISISVFRAPRRRSDKKRFSAEHQENHKANKAIAKCAHGGGDGGR